ncbi:MAG: VOC family protein, partial [Betaproteobacteria bacterium]|nr:VOC family protein [Betaproteobacteria bacterium]
MGRVVHFEIQASNPEALIPFYEKLFGWQFMKWEGPMPYWLIKTGEPDAPGIDGGLLPRQGPIPADGASVNCYVCTVDVANLDNSLANIPAGGAMCVPKMAIPGVGWLAYAKDPDGNIFGMM